MAAAFVPIQNQLVEIFGDEDDRYPGCWAGAIFLQTVGKKKALVQYLEFIDDKDGLPLRETVARDRIRPVPEVGFAQFASLKDVQAGSMVEAYIDDCWWCGTVMSIHTAGVRLDVQESNGDHVFVRDHRYLRPRMELVKGFWLHVVPKRSQLVKLGIDSKTADAAVRAAQSAPPVPLGPPRLCPSANGAAAGACAAAPPLPSETGKTLLSPWRRRQGAGAMPGPAVAGPSKTAVTTARLTARRLDAEVSVDDDGAAPLTVPCPGPETDAQLVGVKRNRKLVAEHEDGQGSDDEDEDEDSDGDMPMAGPKGALLPKAAAAEAGGISRPRREGKNRVIYINGIPVLKENMYGLHDEDTMKWQRAVKNGHISLEGVNVKPRQRREPASKQPKARDPAHPPEMQARQEHNAAIRRDSKVSEASRARYLVTHLDKLRPFITPQVEANLLAAAGGAGQQRRRAVSEPAVTQQPSEVLATLREYQLEGLSWLVAQSERGVNAILGDEMGLGKTLQTITFLAHLTFVRRVAGPHLVVVPLSVLSSWMSEFRRWCPSLRVVRLHCTDSDERKRLVHEVLSNPASFDVAVTTYDMINSQHFGRSLKHHLVWRYLVLDEGHKVKNEDTLVSHGMRHIGRQQVLMLTGTPIQNNLHELYALLNFMYPDVFTDPSRFVDAFNLSKRKVDCEHLEAAHRLLRPFMLRRLKEEVETSLPPKVETRIQCPLAPMQTFWYRRLLLRDVDLLQKMEAEEGPQADKLGATKHPAGASAGPGRAGGALSSASSPPRSSDSSEGGASWRRAMNLLIQLRKVCNHPFMFKDAEPDFDRDAPPPEEMVSGSGKMMVLDRLLDRLREKGHRVVVFSQFNIMLDIMEDYLVDKGLKYRRLDGSTNRIKRMIDIEQFNKPGSDIFVYILCTRAGGLGVNLQTADTCILFDSDWNPQWDLQAMARVHRIGQTRPVHVYRLVTGGTVEDRIQRRAEAKLYLDQMVNRGSTSNAEQLEGLTASEVLSMLKFGADRIFRNEGGAMPSDAELEAIMDRSRMVADTEAAKARKQEAEAAEGRDAAKAAARGSGGGARVMDVGSGEAAAAKDAAWAKEPGLDLAKASDLAAAPISGRGVETAAKAGAGAGLVEHKQCALGFDAEAPVTDTFMFQGMNFRALRASAAGGSMRDIASEFWAGKRQRKERLMEVDGFQVLRENNYTMQEGMLHHPGQQRGGETKRQTKLQRAGIDYEHMDYCLICWDGGDLLCCDHCPAAFHIACLGLTEAQARAAQKRTWTCPHHQCTTCDRNTAKAGGLLFRCEMCSNSYCEDDLPPGYHMVGECEMFKALGQRQPAQACFIHCSDRCKELAVELRPRIQPCMDRAEASCLNSPDLRVPAGPSTKAASKDKAGAAANKRGAAAKAGRATGAKVAAGRVGARRTK